MTKDCSGGNIGISGDIWHECEGKTEYIPNAKATFYIYLKNEETNEYEQIAEYIRYANSSGKFTYNFERGENCDYKVSKIGTYMAKVVYKGHGKYGPATTSRDNLVITYISP